MEPTSSMEQQFLKKLIEIIDANLHDEQFGVNELAAELGMSRSNLHRKVSKISKVSASHVKECVVGQVYRRTFIGCGEVINFYFVCGSECVSYLYVQISGIAHFAVLREIT